MRLNDYLTEHGITQSAFAERVGCRQATIARFVGGTRVPTSELMAAICRETQGQVTPNDFFDLTPAKHCPLCDTSTPGDIAACTCVDCQAREREAA